METEKFFIIPDTRTITVINSEKNSQFTCPTNTVMTGRYHKGDENAATSYQYATLKAVDSTGNPVAGTITVENIQWESYVKESSGIGYVSSNNRVVVGRQHLGDENGNTRYATGIIKFNGVETMLEESVESSAIKESSGIWFTTDNQKVLIGRRHNGDENGNTWYTSAKVVIPNSSTDPAPEGTLIVPFVRQESSGMSERDSLFMCPAGSVMTGRSHVGDEGGTTKYEFSSLKAVNAQGERIVGTITIENIQWYDQFAESSGCGFDAPKNHVIVGRQHNGDENGATKYATGQVFFNGHPTEIRDYDVSETKTEAGGWNWFKTANDNVMTGRHHFGDENGNTYYSFGVIHCDSSPQPQGNIEVEIVFHPEEKSFPMDPMHFIKLSRFRRHIDGGSDYGYNKNTNQFVNNNDHTSEYYNIPVSVINSYYHPIGEHMFQNMRPYDHNSPGTMEVFLEPDDNLRGHNYPTGIVPVFSYSTFYANGDNLVEHRELWMFFGYNDPSVLIGSGNHQGDWERITLDIYDGRVIGAWLSCHKDSNYYSIDDLSFEEVEGKQILKVFCAKGSHALYKDVGSHYVNVTLTDVTAEGDCKWCITDKVLPLESQPWKLYAGAWGEVGSGVAVTENSTTGPLGPWYKTEGFGKQDDSNIPISSFIHSNKLLIIPDVRSVSGPIKENDGIAFAAPANCVITGMKHSGDEEENTYYEYATLKAVNYLGEEVSGTIVVGNLTWTEEHQESDSANFYITPYSRVIVGRQHTGDENGNTKYLVGTVSFNGSTASIVSSSPNFLPNVIISQSSGVFFRTGSKFILRGRTHTGDENGDTTFYPGYILIQ